MCADEFRDDARRPAGEPQSAALGTGLSAIAGLPISDAAKAALAACLLLKDLQDAMRGTP